MEKRKKINKYLKRLKNGEDCFDEFFCETSCYAEYIAKKYLNDRSFAEDVINETYENIWKCKDNFDENKNGYGLLCKIAKNLALERNVIESRNKAVLVDTIDDNIVKDSYSLPDIEGKIDFYSAVQTLPEIDRTIVEERVIYEKTLKEIGAEVGVSFVTVYNRLNKSYKELKKIMKKK